MSIEVADMTPVDVVAGTELIPASLSGSPVSITPAQLLAYINATVFPTGSLGRITSDGLQLKNITTGKFHTVYLEGSEGVGTLKFKDGVE